MKLHFHRATEMRLIAGETLAQAPIQFRVAGLPHFVPDMNTVEINVTSAKREKHRGCAGFGIRPRREAGTRFGANLINPSAFFFFLWVARVEHYSITGFDRGFKAQECGILLNAQDLPEINTALLAESCMHEFLVVGASEPAGIRPREKAISMS